MDKLDEFRDHLVEVKHRSPDTVKKYCADVRSFEASGLTPQKWLAQRSVSGSRYNMMRCALIAWYKWNGYHLADIPDLRGDRQGDDPEFLTVDETQRWIAAFESLSQDPTSGVGLRDVAMAYLLWATGLRNAEVRTAKLDDLDLQARTLQIIGKGRKKRTVPFDPYTATVLGAYIRLERPKAKAGAEDLIFLGVKGGQLDRRLLVRAVRRAFREAGITRMAKAKRPVHTIRHSFSTHLNAGGMDLASNAKLMGHARITQTQHYIGIAPDVLHKEYDSAHPLARGKSTPAAGLGVKHGIQG